MSAFPKLSVGMYSFNKLFIEYYTYEEKGGLGWREEKGYLWISEVNTCKGTVVKTRFKFTGWPKIVLLKSLINCKRCNKGNFALKSNSNKIMMCGGGGQHYLF